MVSQSEIEELFWSRMTKQSNGCLEWTLSKTDNGYGQCWFEGKRWYTHRLAYKLKYNIILTRNDDVHHKCHNKICCNPNHLEVLSKSHHASLDSYNKQKIQCINGHNLNKNNIYLNVNGHRSCKVCRTNHQRKFSEYKGGIPNKNKTCCKHGHTFDINNTYLRSNGARACKQCKLNSKQKTRTQQLYG